MTAMKNQGVVGKRGIHFEVDGMEKAKGKGEGGRYSVNWEWNRRLSCEGGKDWSMEWIKKNRTGFGIVFAALP